MSEAKMMVTEDGASISWVETCLSCEVQKQRYFEERNTKKKNVGLVKELWS